MKHKDRVVEIEGTVTALEHDYMEVDGKPLILSSRDRIKAHTEIETGEHAIVKVEPHSLTSRGISR